eukprot:TRINITY_DN34751_c0_g1_i1.p1 TRINITY_DN34751_c0_g1~~TRINITY_DN34751_c0_g1_i1.p1  ORF type:complete len:184 (+),score=41.35 TRINITY_DN34751_c0_g1_i1:37-552(+)
MGFPGVKVDKNGVVLKNQAIGKEKADSMHTGLFDCEDWQCSSCGNINWARRKSCNQCKTVRDLEGLNGPRTGAGGGYCEIDKKNHNPSARGQAKKATRTVAKPPSSTSEEDFKKRAERTAAELRKQTDNRTALRLEEAKKLLGIDPTADGSDSSTPESTPPGTPEAKRAKK